jgi:hypothetical protein
MPVGTFSAHSVNTRQYPWWEGGSERERERERERECVHELKVEAV